MRIRNTRLLQIKQLQNIQDNQEFNAIVITNNYLMNNNENVIFCDNQSNITVTLPVINAETEKKLFIIRRINTGNVTILIQQNNIFNVNAGIDNLILSNSDCGVILKAKGNIWYVIQKINCENLTSVYENGRYGYICGGYDGVDQLSIIDRLHFLFDSGNVIQVGNLNRSSDALSANNSSIHGYVCGGYVGPLSIIDRFQFPFDSGNAIYVGNLSVSRSYLSANDDTFIPNVMY